MNKKEMFNQIKTIIEGFRLKEYNVLPDKGYNDFFDKIAKGTISEETRNWFLKAIKKKIPNDLDYLTPITEVPTDAPDWAKETKDQLYRFSINRKSGTQLNQIIDYLLEMESNNDPLIKRLNRMSFDQILEKAIEWERKDIEIKDKSKIIDEEKKIANLSSGWKIVNLFGQSALENEGNIMNNCIGKVYNMEMINKNDIKIYSIRDGSNVPHIDIAVKGDKIIESQGKNNQLWKKEYQIFFNQFVEKLNIEMADIIKAGYGIIDIYEEDLDDYENITEEQILHFIEISKDIMNQLFLIPDKFWGKAKVRDHFLEKIEFNHTYGKEGIDLLHDVLDNMPLDHKIGIRYFEEFVEELEMKN